MCKPRVPSASESNPFKIFLVHQWLLSTVRNNMQWNTVVTVQHVSDVGEMCWVFFLNMNQSSIHFYNLSMSISSKLNMKNLLFGQHVGESEAVSRNLYWKERFYRGIEVKVLNSSMFWCGSWSLFLFWGILFSMNKVMCVRLLSKALTASL